MRPPGVRYVLGRASQPFHYRKGSAAPAPREALSWICIVSKYVDEAFIAPDGSYDLRNII
jgi:hypothetical protein